MDKEKIGSYLISDRLYEGRFAITYKATHEYTGNVRALRMHKFHIPADKADIRRILRIEATVFSELYNSQIIRTYDSGFHKDLFYTVTDLIGGETLAERLSRESTLPAETVLKIALNISQAVAYAHELGIIHSDLTPANIFIREGFADAVVTDFRKRSLFGRPELKKLIAASPEISTSPSRWEDHAAPESQLTEEYTARTDIYQMGLVLHNCIYGVSAASGGEGKEERRDLPPLFIKLVKDCIRENAQDRPMSAEKLHLEFQKLYSEFKARKEKGEESYEQTEAVETAAEPVPEAEPNQTEGDERPEQYLDFEGTSRPALKVQKRVPENKETVEVSHDFSEVFGDERSQAAIKAGEEDEVLPKNKTWEPGEEEPEGAAEYHPKASAQQEQEIKIIVPQEETAEPAPEQPEEQGAAAEPVTEKTEQEKTPEKEEPVAEKKRSRVEIKTDENREELSSQEAQKKAELAKLRAIEKAKHKRGEGEGGNRLFRDGLILIILATCYATYHFFGATLGINLFTKYRQPLSYKYSMLTPPMRPSKIKPEPAPAVPQPQTPAATPAEEAKRRAEETAKLEAEAELKRKAEEAASKAEEARLKAESEKKQAQEAKLKAEAKTKLKAENDMKLMREAEAKRKAEIQKKLLEEKKKKAEAAKLPAVPGMSAIASAKYFMGKGQDRHAVTLSPFYIDSTEVTVEQYNDCIKSNRCNPPKPKEGCNWGIVGREQHPINCIGWMDANSYCTWKGKRLPTEGEWELAAKGVTENSYPWGNTPATCARAVIPDQSGVKGCGANSTQPVGSKAQDKSPYGAMDMAGNVSEYVNDWYSIKYGTDAKDPSGPLSGTLKVTRGGSWQDNASSADVTVRNFTLINGWSTGVGFRCAKSAK